MDLTFSPNEAKNAAYAVLLWGKALTDIIDYYGLGYHNHGNRNSLNWNLFQLPYYGLQLFNSFIKIALRERTHIVNHRLENLVADCGMLNFRANLRLAVLIKIVSMIEKNDISFIYAQRLQDQLKVCWLVITKTDIRACDYIQPWFCKVEKMCNSKICRKKKRTFYRCMF